MERNFKGIWIPKEIWLADNLSLQEKVLLVEIDSLDDEETGCYASNSYFAKFFSLTNARITQLINSLVLKGFITTRLIREGKEVKQRIIKINRPPYPDVVNKFTTYLENLTEGSKYSKQGYLENYEDNNISINNININNIKHSKFIKPTIEEINKYCEERQNHINAENFYNFYESKGWKIGKNSMKDWKACIRTWEQRNNNNLPKWVETKYVKEETTKEDLQELENLLKEFK